MRGPACRDERAALDFASLNRGYGRVARIEPLRNAGSGAPQRESGPRFRFAQSRLRALSVPGGTGALRWLQAASRLRWAQTADAGPRCHAACSNAPMLSMARRIAAGASMGATPMSANAIPRADGTAHTVE